MTRSNKSLGFLLVTMLGAYGCAKGPTGSADGRTAAAEAKAQRLEEDFRAAAAARDSFRQRLIAAEEKQGQLQKQLDQAQSSATQDRRDRDAARTELKARTAERDSLQAQYDSFRTNLKELLGQAETALTQPPGASPPVLVGSQTPAAAANVRN